MLAIIIPAVGISNPLQYSFFFFPLQYSCLESSNDRRAWRAAVLGVAELNPTEWLSTPAIFIIVVVLLIIYVASAGLTEGGTVLRVW